jgi:hypothetical protein
MVNVVAAQASLTHLADNDADPTHEGSSRQSPQAAVHNPRLSEAPLFALVGESHDLIRRSVRQPRGCQCQQLLAIGAARHSVDQQPSRPAPSRAMVAANKQPIDVHTHMMNDQAWCERNHLDANYNARPENRHDDPN